MINIHRAARRAAGAAVLAALGFQVAQSPAHATSPLSSEGSVTAGAHGSVTIKRDGYGVPHIYSSSVYGLFYGFGYAVAEDQLFQMEMLRRTATGSVAEVLGADYLEHDRAVRGNYTPASLMRQYGMLEPEDRAIFEGYAAGLNARVREVLSARGKLLPHEFTAFGFDPVEWSPLDVITLFNHSIALRFSDANSEIGNLGLLTQLKAKHGERDGWNIFEQLRWTHDRLAPTTVSESEQPRTAPPTFAAPRPVVSAAATSVQSQLAMLSPAAIAQQTRDQLARLGGVGPDAFPHASNVWLVAPGRTTSGEAVLVNGPQMGDFSPGYIWSAGLHGAGFDLVGSGPMGSPWFIFGTNGRIGWGSTAGFGDTVDIYQEKLHPEDPHQYFFQGRYWPMEKRVETIRVKGGAPVQHEVYSTVHGLVVQFDQAQGVAYSKKRTWEGSELQSLVSWIHSMRAGDFTEWRKSLAAVSISVNNYYVDAQGNIGYTFLGRFPRRPPQQDFRLPASGTGEMEWQGTLPFETNPWVLNPRQGYIANWNNKPQPSYNSSDSMYWSVVDHVAEIDELLRDSGMLATGQVWDVNQRLSFIDDNARYFLPLIARAATGWGEDTPARRAATLLEKWDRRTVNPADATKTSPGYLLFRTFLANLIDATLSPHIDRSAYAAGEEGEAPVPVSPYFPTLGTKVTYNALLGEAAGVPQAFDFFSGRQRDVVLREALEAAMATLSAKHGKAPARWSEPAYPHRFMTTNYARVPHTTPSNQLELPAAMNRGTENNQIVFGPKGMRYCDVTPPGQSGFVRPDGSLSVHFKDQLQLYARFQCKSQWLHAEDVERNTKSRRELQF